MSKLSHILCLIVCMFTLIIPQAAADQLKKGKKLFVRKGCVTCHKKDGMGKTTPDKLALQKGPQIAGLDSAYIVQQVNDILSKKRVTDYTADMIKKVGKLSPEKISALAAYISQLADPHKGMLQE